MYPQDISIYTMYSLGYFNLHDVPPRIFQFTRCTCKLKNPRGYIQCIYRLFKTAYVPKIFSRAKPSFQNLVFSNRTVLTRRRRRQTVFLIPKSNFLPFLVCLRLKLVVFGAKVCVPDRSPYAPTAYVHFFSSQNRTCPPTGHMDISSRDLKSFFKRSVLSKFVNIGEYEESEGSGC